MAAEIHVNDVDLSFRLTFKDDDEEVIDISDASIKIVFEKPLTEGQETPDVVEFDGEFYTDGTDGIAEYITEDGDLDRTGKWSVQGVAYFPGDKPLHSNIHKFKVFRNLKADN